MSQCPGGRARADSSRLREARTRPRGPAEVQEGEAHDLLDGGDHRVGVRKRAPAKASTSGTRGRAVGVAFHPQQAREA